ncbi:MAG: hypothetical protein JWN93_683 [Hyphomicrobiales bacterium]|nr:hypothetical protein [Hyphomicrobiales bacterium]
MGGMAFIGTAGWSIPRIHQSNFPPEGSHLARYASVFSAAEINSSFYRPHRKSTYERWAQSTPDDFRFSVKAPKLITHAAGEVAASDIDAFFTEITGLGTKLGPILIQLPPKRSFVPADALQLLSAFRNSTDGDLVLEPRHASWFEAEAEWLLKALKIARVAADPPRAAGADLPGGWAGLIYYRLHGSPHIYRSAYGEERLTTVARSMQAATAASSAAWCVFDNTTSYAAAGDALALRRLLRIP